MPFKHLTDLIGRRKDSGRSARPGREAEEVESGEGETIVAHASSATNEPTSSTVTAISADSEISVSRTRPIGKAQNIGLTLLYDPGEGKGLVDIVFIHGLTGNAYNTWLCMDKNTSVYWPYDLLREDYPDARILAFGYDADVTEFWGPASSNRVGNHAENLLGYLSRLRVKTNTETRKTVFIVHSLGGLVAECALNLSRSSPQDDIRSIERDTLGIAFLGTPHHGSDYAQWVTMAENLTKWIKRTNKDIVRVLQPESEVLAMIQKGFQGLLSQRVDEGSKIHIVCFFEELPVTGLGDIVPKHSAILPAFPSYGIRANHMDMTKFNSARSPGYESVEGEIYKWIKPLRSGITYSSNLQEDFLESLEFNGMWSRMETIDQAHPDTLHWIWSRSHIGFKEWLQSGTGIFWISGKAGSGKSTLMKELGRSSMIKRQLERQELTNARRKDVMMAEYFFDYKGSAMGKSTEGMIRAVLHQLVSARSSLFQPIEQIFKEMEGKSEGVIWNLNILSQCLTLVIQTSLDIRFFLLVDALDEYNGDDSTVASFFTGISKACPENLQICVSSRPHIDFREHFSPYAGLRVEHETHDDVNKYATGVFQDYIQRHGHSYSVLVDEVVGNAQGLFIWVKLASNELLRAARRGEEIASLQRRLRDMPQDLDDFYQRILDQIDPDDLEEARAMLTITIVSPKPLLPLVLRHAVHFATGLYTEFTDYLSETRILAVCGGFLEFGEIVSSGKSRTRFPGPVRLAHRSVFQFLSKRAPEILETRDQDGNIVTGETLLFKACINAVKHMVVRGRIRRYEQLTREESDSIRNSENTFSQYGREIFYAFALRRWLDFAQRSEWKTTQVQPILGTFSEDIYEGWRANANIVDPPFNRTLRHEISPFYLELDGLTFNLDISDWPGFSLWSAVPSDEAAPSRLNSQSHSSNTFSAVAISSYATAKTEPGATYSDRLPNSLLCFMTSCGVNLYAEQSMQHRLSLTQPLQLEEAKELLYAAARGGSVSIAQWAFDRIGNAPADNVFLAACLTRAILYRHLRLVNLFLENEVDPYQRAEFQLRHFGSPMEVAIKYYNRDAIVLLIDHGFDLTRRISFWGSALQVATRWQIKAAQQLLLERGAGAWKLIPTDLGYLIHNPSAISEGFSRWRDRAKESVRIRRREGSLRFLGQLKSNNPTLTLRKLRTLVRFCIIWLKVQEWQHSRRRRLQAFNALSPALRTKIFNWRIRAIVNIASRPKEQNILEVNPWSSLSSEVRSKILDWRKRASVPAGSRALARVEHEIVDIPIEAIEYGLRLVDERASREDLGLEITT